MSEFVPNNILVTGSAGFIGSNFVRYLLANNDVAKIISLDKLTYAGDVNNLGGVIDHIRHQFIVGDICDCDLVLNILREHQIDTIVHFAAESHVDRSIANPVDFVQTNFVGTCTLLDVAKKYWLDECGLGENDCRFHHVSTDEVYGHLTTLEAAAFTERNCYSPRSPYSATKSGADHMVRAYFYTYGLPVTISVCGNNYGPNQHREKLIPAVIASCLQNAPINIYGDGSNIRDWIYVVDHCAAILRIILDGRIGDTYNVGGHNELRNLDLVRKVCRVLDEVRPLASRREDAIVFMADRSGHDWRYAIDDSKIRRELGWLPLTSFSEGLLLTVNHYIDAKVLCG